MTLTEVAKLLGLMTVYDQRETGEHDIEAWEAAVGDLEYEDARQAVIAWYRSQSQRIMPSDVQSEVKRIRDDKLGRAIVPAPPSELTEKPDEYQQRLQASIRKMADKMDVNRALRDRPPATEPSQEYRDMRAALAARQPAAMDPREKARQQVEANRRDRARRGEPT